MAMTPHLVRWNERFAGKGLKTVYVFDDDGESSPLDAVREHVASLKLPYAILHDPTGAAAASYRVGSVPRSFLVDRRGKIVWAGNPLQSLKRVEAAIEKALDS